MLQIQCDDCVDRYNGQHKDYNMHMYMPYT